MTPAQLATLKAAILADPALAAISSGAATDYPAIADALNAPSNPVVKGWITNVPASDSDDAPDMSTFDALAAGKRDSWALFLGQDGRDFTRNKVRKWVTDIWGNSTAGSNAEAILQAGTVIATRAEVAIGGVTKTTGTVSGLVRICTGQVTVQDVNQMFAV